MAFTIADSGNPQLVVLASAALFNRGSFDWVHLWTIRVGVDEKWSGYVSTKWQLPRRVEMILRVVIVGHLAYFFNQNSHVFVFDLLNLQFQETVKTTTDEFSSESCWFCVMENRGEIYKLVLANRICGVIPMFYRLKKITKNNTDFDWEGLNSEEFKDKCWYLIRSQGYQCFVFEEKGQCEIYQNLGVWYDEYSKTHFFKGNLVEKVMSQPIQGCVIKEWADMG
ncbi:hypothetical protein LOK49_LG04G03322 [Camellia lanceoleosa]|uniref:Uncharacterized protein n=1 Tax=Camellia lanceoleosa TaxID=1840588 RepID=A0ACC0HYP1_9ERIC|nr:hypothetical protein LOK49_LG04G03322 [Camellia lanceoleosa]